MSILHHDHNDDHDHELADKLTIGGFCALVVWLTPWTPRPLPRKA